MSNSAYKKNPAEQVEFRSEWCSQPRGRARERIFAATFKKDPEVPCRFAGWVEVELECMSGQKIRDLGLPGNWALYFFSKLWYKFEDRNLPLHQRCEKRRGVGVEERRGREATQEGFTAAAPLVRPQIDS